MEKYFDTRLEQRHRKGAADVWRLVAADIQRRLPEPAARVLDLGAGYGDFVNGVGAQEKWAVDQWQGFTKHLVPGVRGVVSDIRALPAEVPQKHFDLCFMSNVMEHFTVEDGEKILQGVERSLRPGGYLVLLQPNFTYCSKHYFDDYTHKTIYTAEGMGNFLRDHGYDLVSVYPRYLPFSFKSRLPRPLWAVWFYLRSPFKPMAAQMLLIAKRR